MTAPDREALAALVVFGVLAAALVLPWNTPDWIGKLFSVLRRLHIRWTVK